VSRTLLLPAALVALGLAAGCRTVPEPSPVERLFGQSAAAMRQARPVPGVVTLDCPEPDAEVVVDGVLQGRCADFDGRDGALRFDDEVGHVIEVRKAGFRSWQAQLLPGQARAVLHVKLLPLH
jgi:hypothetical protein